MNGLGHDLRYAFRSLARRPGLAVAAIATLALGIGANVAVFSVVDGLILRRLPVRDPSSLALLTWSARSWPKVVQDLEGSSRKEDSGETWTTSFPFPVYEAIASRSRAFSRTFALMANDPSVNVRIGGRGASAVARFASGSFFDVLGVLPAAGRLPLPSDDRPGAPPVAAISHRFWERMLGSDPSAIGRPVAVNGKSVLLVGVLPAKFFGLEPGTSPDLWLPLRSFSAVLGDYMGQGTDPFRDPSTWWIEIGGSLRPGATRAAAREDSRRIFESFLPAPAAAADPGRPVLGVRPIARGEDWTRHRLATPLLILFGLSGIVLAIACTNVAGLLLAKATARTREIAIRRSLGANTARLVRQLLTESLVLALAASAAAWLLAQALTAGVLSVMARSRHPLTITSAMNGRALLFGIAAAAVTGVFAGLLPAWRVSHAELTPSLKEAAPAGLGGGARGAGVLVAAQVGLGLLLVAAAGLFARTLVNLRSVELGFRPDHLVLFSVRPGLNGYSGERLSGFYDDLRRRLEAIPGVRAATLALHGVIGGGASTTTIQLPGGGELDSHVNVVGARYFDALRVPIVAGRPIDERDRSPQAPAAVVNTELARKLFGAESPLGKTFSLGPRQPKVTVVGVSGNVRYNRLRDSAPPTFYVSFRDRPTSPDEMTFHVLCAGDPGAVMAAVREAVASIDPNLPVVDLQTQDDAIDGALAMERVFAILTGAFAALALLLAAIGLYAALAFSVARRTREIGVRIALGATASRIRRSILRDALAQTFAGLAAGAAGAVALGRVLRSQLFGLSALDPGVLAGSAAVLLSAAALAAWLPARRASSVDPMTALRAE